MIDRLPNPSSEIIPPRYELSAEELAVITDELIESRAGDLPSNVQFVSVLVGPHQAAANVARHIERAVFETKFISNDVDFMTAAYAPYEDASKFFIVLDRASRKAASALRIIPDSAAGLMTLNDIEKEPFKMDKQRVLADYGITDLSTVLDVSTVATLPEYRGRDSDATPFAYRSMFVWAQQHGKDYLVSMIDEPVYNGMKQFYGFPFELIKGAQPGDYMDSAVTYPVIGYVPDFIRTMEEQERTSRAASLVKRALDTMIRGDNDHLLLIDDDAERLSK